MSDEPIRIHAQGQHVTVRLVREPALPPYLPPIKRIEV